VQAFAKGGDVVVEGARGARRLLELGAQLFGRREGVGLTSVVEGLGLVGEGAGGERTEAPEDADLLLLVVGAGEQHVVDAGQARPRGFAFEDRYQRGRGADLLRRIGRGAEDALVAARGALGAADLVDVDVGHAPRQLEARRRVLLLVGGVGQGVGEALPVFLLGVDLDEPVVIAEREVLLTEDANRLG